MIQRPPKSTLFPTRRSSDLKKNLLRPIALVRDSRWGQEKKVVLHSATKNKKKRRSEEHTSELQSRRDLVCRLLLEKKKKNGNVFHKGVQPCNTNNSAPMIAY